MAAPIRPPALMVPELPVFLLDVIGEGGWPLHQAFAFDHIHNFRGRFGELVVVEFAQGVILIIMTINKALLMAVEADTLYNA